MCQPSPAGTGISFSAYPPLKRRATTNRPALRDWGIVARQHVPRLVFPGPDSQVHGRLGEVNTVRGRFWRLHPLREQDKPCHGKNGNDLDKD